MGELRSFAWPKASLLDVYHRSSIFSTVSGLTPLPSDRVTLGEHVRGRLDDIEPEFCPSRTERKWMLPLHFGLEHLIRPAYCSRWLPGEGNREKSLQNLSIVSHLPSGIVQQQKAPRSFPSYRDEGQTKGGEVENPFACSTQRLRRSSAWSAWIALSFFSLTTRPSPIFSRSSL